MKGNLLIKNAFVPGREDSVDVSIEHGRIQKICEERRIDDNPTKQIDLKGGYLMPGPIDCHVHLILNSSPDIVAYVDETDRQNFYKNALENIRLTLKSGITSVRDMGCFEFIAPELERNMHEKYGSRTITSAGHMITMKMGHVKKIGTNMDPDSMFFDKIAKTQKVNGADWIKIIASGGLLVQDAAPEDSEMEGDIIEQLINAAKIVGLPAAVHAYNDKEIQTSVEAGATSIEHGTWASVKACKLIAKNGVFIVPTLKAAYSIIEHSDELPNYMVQNASRVINSSIDAIRNYKKSGVKICMGTDSGTPYNFHGDNLQELDYLCEAGLPEGMAMETSTTNAAELLGLDHCLGKVSEGYIADLIVCKKNPADDIRNLKKSIQTVIKGGHIIRNEH